VIEKQKYIQTKYETKLSMAKKTSQNKQIR